MQRRLAEARAKIQKKIDRIRAASTTQKMRHSRSNQSSVDMMSKQSNSARSMKQHADVQADNTTTCDERSYTTEPRMIDDRRKVENATKLDESERPHVRSSIADDQRKAQNTTTLDERSYSRSSIVDDQRKAQNATTLDERSYSTSSIVDDQRKAQNATTLDERSYATKSRMVADRRKVENAMTRNERSYARATSKKHDGIQTSETAGQGMAPSELLPKAASNKSTGLRSSDSTPRTITVQRCEQYRHEQDEELLLKPRSPCDASSAINRSQLLQYACLQVTDTYHAFNVSNEASASQNHIGDSKEAAQQLFSEAELDLGDLLDPGTITLQVLDASQQTSDVHLVIAITHCSTAFDVLCNDDLGTVELDPGPQGACRSNTATSNEVDFLVSTELDPGDIDSLSIVRDSDVASTITTSTRDSRATQCFVGPDLDQEKQFQSKSIRDHQRTCNVQFRTSMYGNRSVMSHRLTSTYDVTPNV